MKIKKSHILFSFLFLFGIIGYSQKATGDKYFAKLEYADAIPFYKKDYDKKGDRECLAKLAECYHKTKQYESALTSFEQLEKTGTLQPIQLFYLGQLYYENDQPEKGKEYFKKYAAASGSQWWSKIFDDNSILKTEENNYFISNLNFLNTEYSEFSPSVIGKEILFTSDRPASSVVTQTYGGTHTPFLNIFITEGFSLEDSVFKTKIFHSKSDITSHAGPAVWDSVYSVLYYTFVNDTEKGKVNKATIFSATKDEKKWKNAEKLPQLSGDVSIGHPAIYTSSVMIVSSDLPGGKGGKDLYFYIKGETISIVPVPGVNTPGDEVFPSLRKMLDGKTRLYFSSDGYPGKGGLDLFSMNLNKEHSDTTLTWHKELSSSHDDFGIYFDKNNQGYFSSDRKGGKGSDDIYFFIENPNAFIMCLTDGKDQAAGGKSVAIKKDDVVLQTAVTDENGCLHLNKLPEGANALQVLDNNSGDLKMKSYSSGVMNKNKLMILTGDGTVLVELINEDGKMIEQVVRTVILTDVVTGGPAKNIRIEVRSINGEVVETIMTDENGRASLKKIPAGERFILNIDANEINLDPSLKNKKHDSGVIILDLFGKRTDSLSSTEKEIRLSVLKIKTVDLCLYNQITGEPLAHYTVTLRASDGTPIDTAITDADGCYKFKKLPQGEMILVVENYDGGAIKSKINGLEDTDITAVMIKNSKGMIIESYSNDGRTPRTRTFCVFDKITKEPIKDLLIHLADEKYIIRDSVWTGSDGCFTYHKLNDNDRFLTLILAADEAEFFVKGKESKEESKVNYVALSSNGELLDSISSSGSDYSLGIVQKLILSGCLVNKTDGKPLAFTKVYFKDEKGIRTDSVITDKNGCFEYKKLGGSPAQMQVMNNGDLPFEFSMNRNSSLPNSISIRDQSNNQTNVMEPTRSSNSTKNSMICFYDQNDHAPLSGMNVSVKSSSNISTLLTSQQGCISYEFAQTEKYELVIPSDKVVLGTKSTVGGYTIDFKADKNSVSGSFVPGAEVIVHVAGTEFVSANFKLPDGKPVADLPVEWYDSKSGTWSTSLTESNGISKHVFNKEEKEIKVRVKNSDQLYSFSSDDESPNGNVKLLDEKGNLITSTQMNPNKSFSFTVRSMGTDKGDIDIKGTIVSNGNPVNGATIYVKTPQGMLIQRTASDQDGNYFFKKLNSSSMMLEVDTNDLRGKFKTRVELNGTITSNTSGKELAGKEVILGDGTGLKLELTNTDENGNFSFKVDLDKIYAAIENAIQNPWKNISAGVNTEITLSTIYFDYDKWNITFESERELDKALKFLKAFPTASLNIKAHTDSRGNDSYNTTLSHKRARSVMTYFNEHGIDTMRLMSFGYGESQLINKCDNSNSCSDALHKKNRRIEFEISWNGTAHNTRTASPLITSNGTDAMHRVSENTNQIEADKDVINHVSTESGRWYKVQISTSGKLIPCTKENFKGVENVEYYIDNGVYKYTVGKFATKEEAINYRKNVIELFPQAFPVILENGVRVK